MNEKKRVYDADIMALPPLRLVLGEVPSPDPDKARPNGQAGFPPAFKSSREKEGTVKRIIAHLEEKS